MRKTTKIVLLAFIIIGLNSCYDYTLQVGSLALHKKMLYKNNPKKLKKYITAKLRYRPDRWSKYKLILKQGTIVKPLKYIKNWYLVKTDANVTGWVFHGEVTRVPIYKAVYDFNYRSDDNHALIITLPLIIILLCGMLYIDNRLTRSTIMVLLILATVISGMHFAGKERSRFRR